MPTTPRPASPLVGILAAAALLPLLTLAACGSDDGANASSKSGGSTSGMNHSGMDHGSDAGGKDAGMPMGDMTSLGSKTASGMKVTLETMAPETFFIPEGARQVRQAPRQGDTIHLMASLADAQSGIRLPYSTVTAQVKGPGGTAFDGPLYPMIGRGMGLHYGENVPLKAPGTYTVRLVASPPKVGRHLDVEDAWSTTIRTSFTLKWDGKKAAAA